MKALIILLFSFNFFSPVNHASPSNVEISKGEVDFKTVKVCITLMTKEVVCFKIVVDGIMSRSNELNAQGDLDIKNNLLTMQFSKNFNASFRLAENLKLKVGDGYKTVRKGSEVRITEGIGQIAL
jgi:hypothetical protein